MNIHRSSSLSYIILAYFSNTFLYIDKPFQRRHCLLSGIFLEYGAEFLLDFSFRRHALEYIRELANDVHHLLHYYRCSPKRLMLHVEVWLARVQGRECIYIVSKFHHVCHNTYHIIFIYG